MRKIVLGAAASLLVAISAAASAAPDSRWRISEASGEVNLVEGDSTRPAAAGTLVEPGARLATGVDGRAAIVRGDAMVAVSPHSQIRVPADGDGGARALLTEAGTSLVRMAKRDDRMFVVVTPYLVASGRGTTFTVTAGPLGDTVQALDGPVEVTTHDGGAFETITPGAVASLSAGDLRRLRIEGGRGSVIRPRAVREASVSRSAPSTAAPLLPLVPMDVLLADGAMRPVRVAAAATMDSISPADALFAEIDAAARDSVDWREKPADRRREQPADIGKPGKKDDLEAATGGE